MDLHRRYAKDSCAAVGLFNSHNKLSRNKSSENLSFSTKILIFFRFVNFFNHNYFKNHFQLLELRAFAAT